MNTNSTHKFRRLLPGMAMVPASRGSPRDCSEATRTAMMLAVKPHEPVMAA